MREANAEEVFGRSPRLGGPLEVPCLDCRPQWLRAGHTPSDPIWRVPAG
jgi:hypothetical protein